MKKLIYFGIIFLLLIGMIGVANASITIEKLEFGPSDAQTTENLVGNITCQGNGTLTAYWNIFNESVNVTKLANHKNVNNNTKTKVINIPSVNTKKGETWKAKAWCENDAGEKSSIITSSSITIENSAPIAVSSSLTPTTALSTSKFTCSGTASDADGEVITKSYRFMLNNSVLLTTWGASNNYQCTTQTCPDESNVICQFRATDSEDYSNIVNSSAVKIQPPEVKITISDLNLGGSKQYKSNPDEDKYEFTSGIIKIKNTGTVPLENINITNENIGSDYNLSLSKDSISTMGVGVEEEITVRVLVPEDFDSFDENTNDPQQDRRFNIGNLKVSASAGSDDVSAQDTVTLQTKNMLEISNLEITVAGDNNDYDDGDTVDKIRPGDEIEVKVEADSKFSSSSKVKMKDIQFNVLIDDNDLDIDDDQDIDNIGAGDHNEDGTLSFDVDKNLDDGSYNMVVTLTGEDEYGAMHGEQWEISLEVEREDKKIDIKSMSLSPETVSCQRVATLTVKIENVGNDNSDEITLLISNDELGVYSKTTNIDLDTDDDYEKTLTLKIGDSVAEGVYPIAAKTYFDNDAYDNEDISTYETTNLVVKNCDQGGNNNLDQNDQQQNNLDQNNQQQNQQNQDKDQNSGIVIENNNPQTSGSANQPGNSGVIAREPVKVNDSMSDSTFYILMGLAYVIVIIIGVSIIFALLRKK